MEHANPTTYDVPDDRGSDVPGPQWGTARFDQHCHLVLRFARDKSVFSVDIQQSKTAIVGRGDDPAASAPPEVDLSRLEAQKHGVSRQHARIELSDNLLRLIDLGSTNGTRVNGIPLAPHVPSLIRDGDELSFGDLKCQVFFVQQGE